MDSQLRAKQFNPDVVQRELLSQTDLGYRKVMSRDSSLLPLAHEKVPSPTIYSFGAPASVMSIGSQIMEGDSYIFELKMLMVWLKSFLSPLFGPGKMYKLIQTDKGLTLKASNLRLVAKHISIRHPLGGVVLGSGLSVGKLYGDHSIYTSLLTALIVDKCLERIIEGKARPHDCLMGISTFYRIFENFLDKYKTNIPYHELRREDILKNAKIVDNGANMETLVRLAIKISETIPDDVLRGRPVDSILDFRAMETGLLSDSEVVNGVAFPKELPHHTLPRCVKMARVAVIKGGLITPDYLGRHHKITYLWDEKYDVGQALVNKTKLLREYVCNLLDTGANVIVVEKGVDESVFDVLEKRNALLVRGLSPPELEVVAEVTGAKPVSSFRSLDPADLGYAGCVEFMKINGKDWIFFRDCRSTNRLGVILKGCSLSFNQDFEETLKDAVRYIATIKQAPSFVPGGGVTEIVIADQLTEFAERLGCRTSLVLKAIAEAFEQLVSILLYNMGRDPHEELARMRQNLGGITVLDGLTVKLAAIENAITAANTILRIDSFIRARKYSQAEVDYLRRVKGLSKENKRRIRRDYGIETLEI